MQFALILTRSYRFEKQIYLQYFYKLDFLNFFVLNELTLDLLSSNLLTLVDFFLSQEPDHSRKA
jgi:hypothetical protein